MIVVSDTSPITALLTVGKVDLLSQLFGEVIIPAASKLNFGEAILNCLRGCAHRR